MNQKILVVDDNPQSLMTTCRALDNKHYDITMAINSSSGIKQIEANHFDLVITELATAKVDGPTILNTTRASLPEIPLIIIAAIEAMHFQDDIFHLGADDYLFRPLQIEELLFRVNRNLSDLEQRRRIGFYGSILSSCCVCKKVRFEKSERNGNAQWMAMDHFLKENLNILLSSTYCPDCVKSVQNEITIQIDHMKTMKKDSPP